MISNYDTLDLNQLGQPPMVAVYGEIEHLDMDSRIIKAILKQFRIW